MVIAGHGQKRWKRKEVRLGIFVQARRPQIKFGDWVKAKGKEANKSVIFRKFFTGWQKVRGFNPNPSGTVLVIDK